MFTDNEIAKIQCLLALLYASDNYHNGNRIPTELVEELENRLFNIAKELV